MPACDACAMRTSAAFCSIHGCAVRLDTCRTSFRFVTQLVRICGHFAAIFERKDAGAGRSEALLELRQLARRHRPFHHDAGQPIRRGSETCDGSGLHLQVTR